MTIPRFDTIELGENAGIGKLLLGLHQRRTRPDETGIGRRAQATAGSDQRAHAADLVAQNLRGQHG